MHKVLCSPLGAETSQGAKGQHATTAFKLVDKRTKQPLYSFAFGTYTAIYNLIYYSLTHLPYPLLSLSYFDTPPYILNLDSHKHLTFFGGLIILLLLMKLLVLLALSPF